MMEVMIAWMTKWVKPVRALLAGHDDRRVVIKSRCIQLDVEVAMARYEFHGLRPRVARSAFVHSEAVLIGDVVIGEGCYIAPGAVLRGDMGRITIGDGCAFQDNSVAHGDTMIGDGSLISHRCVVHFAKLAKHVFVGVGAVIMDHVELGEYCVVGAGSLVVIGMKVPPKHLVVGSPAKIVRELTDEQSQGFLAGIGTYQKLPGRNFAGLRLIKEEDWD